MALTVNFRNAQRGDMAYAVCCVFRVSEERIFVSNGWVVAQSLNAAIARHIRTVRRKDPTLRECEVMQSQAVAVGEHPGVES